MFSSVRQFISSSLNAFWSNKGRSFLTMLGIIIGISAVIIINAVGAGAQSLILAQIKTMGTDILSVMPGKAEEKWPPASAMGIVITTLTYEDALALKKAQNVPDVAEVVAYATWVANASWKTNEYVSNLKGTTTGHLEVTKSEVAKGRFFTKEEEKNLTRVAVLGSTVKRELFGDSEAIGEYIKIKKHTFEVIGVMKEKGKIAFQDYDDQIYLPLKTTQKLLLGINYVNIIQLKIANEKNLPQAIQTVEDTLRERHDIADSSGQGDDFTVRSFAEALDIITTVTDALRYFLAAMAAMSLLVGGIGIMNIMLVSVTERTQEIGLRKALGATKGDILSQFLIETITITLLGGILGILIGISVSFGIAKIAVYLGYTWEFAISLITLSLAVLVATLIGFIFGLYPANKAARLDPIQALQYE